MNPCCGGSLQTGTKAIAILNMVLYYICIILGILTITTAVQVTSNIDNAKARGVTLDKNELLEAQAAGSALLVYSIVYTVTVTVGLLLALLLLIGAIKRNRIMCSVWFVISVMGVGLTLVQTVTGITRKPGPGYEIIFTFVGILLQSYFIWVVWAFICELKKGLPPTPVGYSAGSKS